MPWYRGIERYCWVVLAIAALGWLFDTMDQNLFNLVRAPSLKELLAPGFADAKRLEDEVKVKGGLVTAIFLVGWSIGGFFFGILGDRIGRARTMIFTILIYALFTGASGLVHGWPLYAAMRFMTALGVGGEWAAGAALVAEVFPERSRPMALGLLQALSAVGNMTAATVTLAIGDMDLRWRWVYFVGAVPGLLVLWIRRSIREPEAWSAAKERATAGRELGRIGQLFGAGLGRRTIAATLLGVAGVGVLWGVGFFSTDMLRGELRSANEPPERMTRLVSVMFFLQQLGGFFGMYLFAAFAERFSRRSAFALWIAIAWLSVLGFFWGLAGAGPAAFARALVLAPLMGFFTLGIFSGFTVYFPELFPTRLRATGCGFCYNAARILAAVAPLTLGRLAAALGGYAPAATIVSAVYLLGFAGAWLGPETRGRGLPSDGEFEVKHEASRREDRREGQ